MYRGKEKSGCVLGMWARSNLRFEALKEAKCQLSGRVEGVRVRRAVSACVVLRQQPPCCVQCCQALQCLPISFSIKKKLFI